MPAHGFARSLPIKPARGMRGGRQAMFARAPLTWGQLLAVLLVGVVIVYLLIAAVSPGYVSDIGTNKTWGRYIAREGLQNIYRNSTDYPPILLFFFGIAAEIYERFVDPTFTERTMLASQFFTFLIKLPGIIFHPVIAGTIYLLVRRFGPGIAFGVAAAYALNPAVAYDVAHLGQTDPVHAAFALLSVGALVNGRPTAAGALIALAALTKPQAWILLPVVGLGLIFWYGRRGALLGTLGGLVASAIVLSPWIVTNRLHHAERFFDALEHKSVYAQALTGQAHNLWWIPTLIEWRFINDWESFIGPISYRLVGLGLVLALVVLVVSRLPSLRPRDRIFSFIGMLVVGWFVVTVRAHENHLFMALPFLAVAWALDRRYAMIFGLVSLSLLMNLALHDPLLVGNVAAGPDPNFPLPFWAVAGQIANVVLNLLTFAAIVVLTLGLDFRRARRDHPAGRPRVTGVGR
jgi:dolichyl-phosphate-mannose-protein mannosyltransferase